jgi:dTDP-4-dehydrorhamnose 3,5-epimerase
MEIKPLKIPDIKLLSPKKIEDSRGVFFEAFNLLKFQELTDFKTHFVQDNQSFSKKNVLRGLHYQRQPFAQGKLVRVIRGEILDVAVDIREDSKHYGQWVGEILSDENNNQLWIPEGFAHGFLVLSEIAEVIYKTTNYYSKEHDEGIDPFDQYLSINWGIGIENCILSNKDKQLPPFLNKN